MADTKHAADPVLTLEQIQQLWHDNKGEFTSIVAGMRASSVIETAAQVNARSKEGHDTVSILNDGVTQLAVDNLVEKFPTAAVNAVVKLIATGSDRTVAAENMIIESMEKHHVPVPPEVKHYIAAHSPKER